MSIVIVPSIITETVAYPKSILRRVDMNQYKNGEKFDLRNKGKTYITKRCNDLLYISLAYY